MSERGDAMATTEAVREQGWRVLEPGQRFGSIEVGEPLGDGGFARVFRGWHVARGCAVALKQLRPELIERGNPRLRFEREARLLSLLEHPHIVKLHAVHETRRYGLVLELELVEGSSLRQRLRYGRLAEPELLRLGRLLADALAHAHQHGVVHRDVKPHNVLLAGDGPRLADFGLAGLLGESTPDDRDGALSRSGQVVGTAGYMAPEQWRGQRVDERADIYALCVLLFEAGVGARPFSAPDRWSLGALVLHGEPDWRLAAGLSPGLRATLRRGLARKPADRHPHMRDLAAELERPASATGRAGLVPEPARRRGRDVRQLDSWPVAAPARPGRLGSGGSRLVSGHTPLASGEYALRCSRGRRPRPTRRCARERVSWRRGRSGRC